MGRHRGEKILILGMLGICALLFFIHSRMLTFIANYLFTNDPLYVSDAIIILGGERTVREGVKLYQEGYAPKIVMVGRQIQWETYEPEIMEQHAISLGVPGDRILILNLHKTSYFVPEEVFNLLRENGFKSAIIVADDYSSRTVRSNFTMNQASEEFKITVYPCHSGEVSPSNWWTSSEQSEIVLREYLHLFCLWMRAKPILHGTS